ncbi:MAG TPA: AarF/ABC1/UbiB kinase family protein [Syntrophomonadaceae bacterium]|jgi:predicted unusual protein kinase regulating ubiquinone biosynthesis (AarF/ABC1/UbiB family)|nr:AarF/ABC1/UbiB kinase family protein [Syntrophomonadaceae bacterium]
MDLRLARLRISRFYTVVSLFLKIFWSFYSIKYKKLWHGRNWPQAQRQKLFVSEARRFRHTAVELGGLLIKLGQFFSTRVDVFPQSTIKELTGLQDEVEPVPFREVRQVAEEDMARSLEEVYAQVEEMPVASASLGQVHRGVLSSGETVAIKIQRPGIDEMVRIDLKAIALVIDIIKRLTDWESKIDLDAIYAEFAETLLDELDYVKEGHNAETIAANTRARDENILFPAIFWDYTTHRVLTMEYMEGIKITNYDELSRLGVDRNQIALILLRAYINQILADGFFHADPHPGNLFITPEGQLVMLDFGMVGSIPEELKEVLIDLVLAIVKRDNVAVVGYFKKIGFLRYDADTELVARAVGLLLEETLGTGIDFAKADFSGFLKDLETLLYEQPFQIPAQFTFMGRALGTLYGICIGLDPNFNFLDEAKPYLSSFARKDAGVWDAVKEKSTLFATSLLEVPPLAEKVLRRMEKGDLNVKLSLAEWEGSLAANTRAIYYVAAAVVFGFAILTAAYLQVNGFSSEARWALGAALLLPLYLIRRGRPQVRRRMKAPPPHAFRRQGR